MSRFLYSFLICLIGLMPLLPLTSHAAIAPDASYSTINASKFKIRADGIDSTYVGMTLRDFNYSPIVGEKVTLTSSRGSMDEIIEERPVTTILGQARFLVRSLRNGQATFTARIGDYVLGKTITLTFENGLAISIQPGELIKIPDDGDVATLNDTAVYYYATDGKRYVFPNEKVYYTWYHDFERVRVLSLEQMSLIPIGGNITYRPGSKLVKFQTDYKTYLPMKGGQLVWMKSETVARDVFGADWMHKIDDISEAFYVNYRFDGSIDSKYDAPLDLIRTSVRNIDDHLGLTQVRFP